MTYRIAIFSALFLLTSPVFADGSLVDPMKPQYPSVNSGSSNNRVLVKKPVVKKKPAPLLHLESIAIVGNYKRAVVNGVYLTTGNTLRGAKLIDIERDSVTFLFQGKSINLKINTARAVIIQKPIINEGSR